MSLLFNELVQLQSKEVISLDSLFFPVENHKNIGSVLHRIQNSNDDAVNTFSIDMLETNKIFTEAAIKKLALEYRLRFLNTKLYKNEIPESAIQDIEQFENENNILISNFKILAPKQNFQLHNYDDPLLFMTLGNGYYYYLSSWGNDLSKIRKIMYWPTQNLMNSCLFSVVLAALILMFCWGINANLMELTKSIAIFLFAWKSVVAIMIYYFFLTGNFPSEYNWNSKFYNQ